MTTSQESVRPLTVESITPAPTDTPMEVVGVALKDGRLYVQRVPIAAWGIIASEPELPASERGVPCVWVEGRLTPAPAIAWLTYQVGRPGEVAADGVLRLGAGVLPGAELRGEKSKEVGEGSGESGT